MMAWLTAVPRVKPATGAEIKYPARIESYRKSGAPLPLPPVTASYLFDWLMEVGPTETTGMGRAPVSWQAIEAWRGATSCRLLAWEARLLRRLSIAFLAESQAAEDHRRAPPWTAPAAQVDHEAAERQLRAVLG